MFGFFLLLLGAPIAVGHSLYGTAHHRAQLVECLVLNEALSIRRRYKAGAPPARCLTITGIDLNEAHELSRLR
ncbi:MAG: hypothetical protein CFE29_30240 [Bradyrhizobiaceae bacterium PARB1]|jgi:hypothetical protein|nr:MAG: hypothetical protein CFE29_30240 [Bradyrhizobiaceae bacterium PARB1]